MTNLTVFQRFIELITFDQKAYTFVNQSKDLEEKILDLNKELNLITSELEKFESLVKNAQKLVDEAELSSRELSDNEKAKKKLLDSVENNKEYSAIKKEISNLKELQHKNEMHVVSAWNKLEAAKHNFNKQKTELDQKVSDLEKAILDSSNSKKEIEKELSSFESDRKNKETDLPEEWLNKYSIMRTRVQNPVVPVSNSSCTACFYDINQQDLSSLTNNKLIECRGCFRFLYLKEEEEKQEEAK